MVNFQPRKVPGRWKEGFVLDEHTLSSTYLGDDEYGHPVFDTKHTELGELLFRLKYRDGWSVVDEIADAAASFVGS